MGMMSRQAARSEMEDATRELFIKGWTFWQICQLTDELHREDAVDALWRAVEAEDALAKR